MYWVKKFFIGFILVILMLAEWVIDLIGSLWNIFHNAVKELVIATQKIYDEIKPTKGEPDSRKE